jgi:ribose transport system ATP-binding protein
MAYLKAAGVSKHFGGVAALRDATFEAEKGEVHALLGENGAGKSTFIKILAGAQRPDAGTIEVEGGAVGRLSPRGARARGISAVFQELSLVPDIDVARNIWLESEPHTVAGTLAARRMRRRSEALLEELGFPALPVDEPVRNLPIAQRQLVEIAKAMARRPQILILDEPTSALAPHEVSLVMALMRRHTAGGGLCIFISHRLGEVREIADRATIFRNGTDVVTVRPDAEDDDTIISHIIGRRIDQLFPPTTPLKDPPVVMRARGLGVADRLRDLDFDLREGEILGVGGLQGQGQRELFLRIFGIMKGEGTIEIGGREVRIRSPHEALSEGVGLALIPEDRQHEGLLLSKSVRTNLTLTRLRQVSRLGFIQRSAERSLSQRLIEELEIAADRDTQPVDSLSGGNQQKVVIGKFLSSSVRVLLCYDPTRGVDVGSRHAIFELMHELAAEGKAILFFSTDNSELINVAHRVMVLAGGSISAMLEREGLSETSIVRAALAGKAKEAVA